MKLLNILLFLFAATILIGQARENRKPLSFTQSSQTINHATGWAYNSTHGEWIDFDNVISSDKKMKELKKNRLPEYLHSRNEQSFISLKVKTLEVDSITYYVLIHEKWKGRYKYPNIYEDWQFWKVTYGYIFPKEEYLKLSKLDTSYVSELTTNKRVMYGAQFYKFDEQAFLNYVRKEILKEAGPYDEYEKPYVFPIKITIADGKEYIRFYMPEKFGLYDKYDFEKSYFELEPEQFGKLTIQN
jgi:hypothetical protein